MRSVLARVGPRAGLLAGLFLAALTLRPQVVGLGPLIPDIQADLSISHAVAGLVVTIPVICMGLFAPPAAGLAGRVGAVHAVTIAIAFITVGGLVRLAFPGVAGLLIVTVAVGIGMGLGNALMVVAVKEAFADRPLLVTGVYTGGIQLGSALAAAVAVPIADSAGTWKAAPLVFSLAAGACLVAWVWLSRGAPRPPAMAAWPRFPWRSKLPWVLVAMFVLMGVIYYGLTAWLPDAYVEEGFTEAETGWLAAILNIFTVPAAILVGVVGHRVTRRRGLVLMGSLMLVSTALLAVAPDGAWLWIAGAGFANGAMFTFVMSLPLEVSDHPIDVGAVTGMMLFFGYLGIAVAPFALGVVRDATGSFEAVLAIFPIAAALFICCSLLLSPARLRRGVRVG